MEKILTPDYWQKRYENQSTPWDIGEISTPLKNYINQLKNKLLSILIPGAGNAYEAEYLHQKGFENVHIVDLADEPLQHLKMRCPDFPSHHVHQMDFFKLENNFDLILEQTFFCALAPSLRPKYALKVHELLKPKGKLVGLLFDAPLYTDRPPFGGTKQEYWSYFEPYFKIKNFEKCNNSILPRAGKELFINIEKIEMAD